MRYFPNLKNLSKMDNNEAREILQKLSNGVLTFMEAEAIDCAIQALGDGVKLTDWQKGWLSFNQMDYDLVEKILNSSEPPKQK